MWDIITLNRTACSLKLVNCLFLEFFTWYFQTIAGCMQVTETEESENVNKEGLLYQPHFTMRNLSHWEFNSPRTHSKLQFWHSILVLPNAYIQYLYLLQNIKLSQSRTCFSKGQYKRWSPESEYNLFQLYNCFFLGFLIQFSMIAFN